MADPFEVCVLRRAALDATHLLITPIRRLPSLGDHAQHYV